MQVRFRQPFRWSRDARLFQYNSLAANGCIPLDGNPNARLEPYACGITMHHLFDFSKSLKHPVVVEAPTLRSP